MHDVPFNYSFNQLVETFDCRWHPKIQCHKKKPVISCFK